MFQIVLPAVWVALIGGIVIPDSWVGLRRQRSSSVLIGGI